MKYYFLNIPTNLKIIFNCANTRKGAILLKIMFNYKPSKSVYAGSNNPVFVRNGN